jgi:hypothetical protein
MPPHVIPFPSDTETNGRETILRDAHVSELTSPARSVAPTAFAMTRVAAAFVLAIASFPALLDRPWMSLTLAAVSFLAVLVLGLAPQPASPTVHDRQLDVIISAGIGLVCIWVVATWPATSPVVAVVAGLFLFLLLSLLLVGTRAAWRLWPAVFAWLSAATDGTPTVFLAFAGVLGIALVAVRRRTFRLDRSELGVPILWHVAPWVVVITGVAAAFGWGVLG